MNEIKIRLATRDDLDALTKMQIAFEKYFIDMGCDSYEISADARRRDILELNFSDNPLLRTLVAELDCTVVGRVSFYRGYVAGVPPYRCLHLSGIFVRPEFRGMRIAEKLFDALREIARSENAEKIKLTVWGENAPAVKLYERLGFRRESDDDEHLMYLDV